MNSPHGAGRLVDRTWPAARKARFRKLPVLSAGARVVSDLHNIAAGVFTPLEGFMDRKTMEAVLEKNRLPSGAVWTVPIVWDVPSAAAESLRPGDEIGLRGPQGELEGVLELSEVFAHDKKAHARRLFGTLDLAHPGVRDVLDMGDALLAGRVRAFARPQAAHRLTPERSREIFYERGFSTVAGFQTRNVPHRAHEYLQRSALEMVDGLFIQPIVGWKKKGDYEPATIVEVYPKFIRSFYPRRSVVFGTLDTAMRYAGPKEAVFHAIIRKNFGCTHFIVGRDHAGVGGFYAPYAAHAFLKEIGNLGIAILSFKEPIYCRRCRMIVTARTCGHRPADLSPVSGTIIRKSITDKKEPPEHILRREVYRELLRISRKRPIFND